MAEPYHHDERADEMALEAVKEYYRESQGHYKPITLGVIISKYIAQARVKARQDASHDLLAACEALVSASVATRMAEDEWQRHDPDDIDGCLVLAAAYDAAELVLVECETDAREAIEAVRGADH